MAPRPCLDCGRLAANGTRCEECRKAKDRARVSNRPHYAGTYRTRARAVRETPGPCWICGELDRPDDPWQADHFITGDPASPLLKAHRSCNIRRWHDERRAPVD
jgi:hypothetical protein